MSICDTDERKVLREINKYKANVPKHGQKGDCPLLTGSFLSFSRFFYFLSISSCHLGSLRHTVTWKCSMFLGGSFLLCLHSPHPGHPTGHKAHTHETLARKATLNPALLFSLSCLLLGSSLFLTLPGFLCQDPATLENLPWRFCPSPLQSGTAY